MLNVTEMKSNYLFLSLHSSSQFFGVLRASSFFPFFHKYLFKTTINNHHSFIRSLSRQARCKLLKNA